MGEVHASSWAANRVSAGIVGISETGGAGMGREEIFARGGCALIATCLAGGLRLTGSGQPRKLAGEGGVIVAAPSDVLEARGAALVRFARAARGSIRRPGVGDDASIGGGNDAWIGRLFEVCARRQ